MAVGNIPAGPRTAVGILGLPLGSPLSLASVGMQGCDLHVSLTVTFGARIAGPTWGWTFPIPTTPSLVGAGFAMQTLVADPAANALGVVASDAASAVVGAK